MVWAPILLIHLGGQDSITAYNVEDNELWTRHALTSLSQITIAIYVFYKSWSGGDTLLLLTAVFLFIPGVLKCLEKPWALHSASINSLVNSPQNVRRTTGRNGKIDSIDDFVTMVRGYYSDVNGTPGTTVNFDPSEIFVDLSSPSFDYRLKKLKWFSALDADKTNGWLQKGLSHTFDLLYTKRKMYLPPEGRVQQMMQNVKRDWLKGLFRKSIVGSLLRMIALYLQFGAIGLFHHSHRQAYNDRDVKVTYALLCCTAALEFFGQLALDIVNTAERKSSSSIGRSKTGMDGNVSQHMDAMLYQHNLIGCFICNQRHYIRSFATVLGARTTLIRGGK